MGPAIASGSHTCSGNWALFPTQPAKIPSPATVSNQNGICRGNPVISFGLHLVRLGIDELDEPAGRHVEPVTTLSFPLVPRSPWLISRKSNVPRLLHNRPRPTSIPTSPIRLTMNALLAASQLTFSSYQKPIKRYEQTPTSSQKMKIMNTLDEATSPSIEKQNSER